MAKINSKIDKALRKEVIENGVFLGTVLIFGFNDNIYLYENEVYVEQFKLTDDDYVVTDFYQGSWEVINTNIYNGKFNANEPYAEALIDYMNLYNRSLYLSNKKYREVAKEQFAELKKDYQESGLLDDINALLKKSKSKTFRYSKYESEKNVGKSIKESVDKTFFDFMCDKDFFKGISKQVTKKEKCQFDFYKTPNSYTWLITYKEDESLSINMDERTNDIFIHVTKNGKSGKDFKFPQLKLDDSIDELLEIIFYYVQGNFDSSWYESKKSARKSIEESMNLDYSDFDYKKFENWIIRYLEDYGCEVNTVEIICDDYGYDVEINVENAENLPSRISDKDYGAFIFDAMYTTNCLYLKMPIVRAMKIAEEFSPKVLKVNDDSILIGDKNSDTEIWLDVWTDNDGDEDYIEWDYNQQSFNLNNYEDMVQKYLQQIDDFFYILDGEVSDNF